jgi:hypothetical protein
MFTIVVCDPALRELGGHHPAALQALLSTELIQSEQADCHVYSHVDCPDDYIAEIDTEHVSFYKHFNIDFYKHFYDQTDIGCSQLYIRQLVKEYSLVFKRYEHSEHLLFWFHTLNWQHAYALALTLVRYADSGIATKPIIAGAMYNPYNSQGYKSGQDIKNSLNFELSFRCLNKHANVQLFAADYEISQIYSKVIGECLSIHPCVLFGDTTQPDFPQTRQSKKRILLYTGDAKLNKGFGHLPEMAENLLSTGKFKDSELIIQYTVTNNSPVLADISQQLKRLAEEHGNLTVLDYFMPHQAMHELFNKASVIVFNYEEAAYKHQSSGVLWMAAKYNLTVISLTNVWLNREATRLGLPLFYADFDNLAPVIKLSLLGVPALNPVSEEYADYKYQLFQNVGTWLLNIYETITTKPSNELTK